MQYIIIFIGDQIVLGIARPDLLLLTIKFSVITFEVQDCSFVKDTKGQRLE